MKARKHKKAQKKPLKDDELELEYYLSLEVARAVLKHYKKKSKNTLLVSFEGWIEKELTKLQGTSFDDFVARQPKEVKNKLKKELKHRALKRKKLQ